MTKHLQRDIERLRKHILMLGSLVEEAVDNSTRAIAEFDTRLINEVVEKEDQINQMEVDIEEECLKVLALNQPVAIDLRFIIVVLKVNNDLERMGDQAVNIVDRIRHLIGKKPLEADVDFAEMGRIARDMVEQSLKALVRQDVAIARRVMEMDHELDKLHAACYREIQHVMAQDPEIIPTAVSYLTISSNLERIGDLSTNIAEEVIFMEEGEVVRHLDEAG
ncbi:MAG: phosphate signaling complex protein PhoU [Pseudomonadales bacterium]